MAPRFVVIAIALVGACGPVVGDGAGSNEGSGGTSSTSTSSSDDTILSVTVDASGDASTGEPGCAREPGLQWTIEGGDRFPLAAAPLLTGEAVVVGRQWNAQGVESYNESDAFVDVLDAAGAVTWSREYAGANDLYDEAIDVAAGDDGSIYALVVETLLSIPAEKSPTGDARLVVLRYSPTGELLWRWQREHPAVKGHDVYIPEGLIEVVGDRLVVLQWDRDDPANRLELDLDGTFLSELALDVSGDGQDDPSARSISRDGDIATLDLIGELGVYQLRVLRFAPDGTRRWSHMFEGTDYNALTVFAGPGETYVGAYVQTSDVEDTISLHRLEADGSEAWTVPVFAAPYVAYAMEFAGSIAPDGTVLLTGKHVKSAEPEQQQGTEPLWAARYAADGCALWQFETEFPTTTAGGAGLAVVGTVDGAALVLGAYQAKSQEPWLGLVTDAP